MKTLDVDFSDLGGPEALAVASAPKSLDMSETVFDLLLENGVPEATAFLLSQQIGLLAADRAYSIAGSVVGQIMRSLGNTAAGRALELVVCGPGDESLREVARRAGCSHQAILKQAKAARAKMGLPPQPYSEGID